MKGLQGYLFFFLNRTLFFCVNFKIEVGFCEHLAFSFRKSEFVFSKLREFPKLLKFEFIEYTSTARDSTMIVTQSSNVLICLFVRVVVNVAV